MITENELKRKYLEALQEGNAAIFAGAGLSVESGLVNWKELLREIANDIGLDVDKESDLIAVAQYHKNERMSRGSINQEIICHLTKNSKINKKHLLLSRLPIKWYWTTNYDDLIEQALEKGKKNVDVKISQENLAISKPKADVIVYKMHGDINYPETAVVTKDDYEVYNIKKGLFTTALRGDLVSKTFLFIGFSFEDPNLEYILSRIKILLEENQRQHFAFLKKVHRNDFESEKDYFYAMNKQELRVKDLHRYSICSLLLDNYDEINRILEDIEKLYYLNKVFISGSADDYGEWNKEDAITFMHDLSRELIKNEFKVVSGFGVGVGSVIINGALAEIYDSKYCNISEYLELRPFPQIPSINENLEKSRDLYRNEMISKCGIAIFIFGNKKGDNNKIVDAEGVYKEFKIAKENNLIVIPIGSTGFMSKIIFNEILRDINNYPYLENYINILENSLNTEDIIETIINIISSERNNKLGGQ
jgi:hypothetical protein